MFLFFLGTLLFFNKKDWLKFFKVNLLVGGSVTIDALFNWLGGSVRPEGSFFGNPTYTINANGNWQFPGLEYYAIVDKVVPNKNGTFSLRDKLGNQIGTTVKTGTATIKNNPNATFWMYYNLKTGKYVLKVIDSTLPQR